MDRVPKRRKRRKHRVLAPHDPAYYTKAGPVTIYRTDGTTGMQAALTESEFQERVRVRRSISPSLRAKIIRRDKRCRYCKTEHGPFQIDHRVPIALGGSNRMSNLVLACEDCNRRKGASVW